MTSYSTILALHSYREHRLKAVFISSTKPPNLECSVVWE
jgi:hypothetical protein